MSAMSELEREMTDGVIRQLREHQKLETRMAAEYHENGSDDLEQQLLYGARRWEQLVAWAPRVFAECDRLEALAADAAYDAENDVCDAPTIVLEV